MPDIIDESLVQWILSKNPEYFANILGRPLGRCVGTEVTTKFGRLDFIFETPKGELILIELETSIDSASKLLHTTSQLSRYLNLQKTLTSKKMMVALVYAEEGTTQKFQKQLNEFTNEHGLILRKYSILKLLKMYDKMLNQLCRTSGISLGRAVALGITSLSWLNKFIMSFIELDSLHTRLDTISWNELKKSFSSNTNFYVLKRFAEDFELIEVITSKKGKVVTLSKYGRRFRDELRAEMKFNDEMIQNSNIIELNIIQKRILLEILINGNFTKIKVNIFHFLRFVHMTEGDWLPKTDTKLTKPEQQYLNNTFRTSYNSRTLKDIVQQTCTFCEELGLAEKMFMQNQVYDKVVFTTLGSRVYNYFEQLLNVERERHQIPQQMRS